MPENMTMEALNWTNVKTVKEYFSDKRSDAQEQTKKGNKLFKQGSYKEAKEAYKKALPLWKDIRKNIADIPEQKPGLINTTNFPFFIPYIGLVASLVVSGMAIDATKNAALYGTDNNKINEEISKVSRTKSLSKATLIDSITRVIDYVEFQIKACDKPPVKECVISENMELALCMLEAAQEIMEAECENGAIYENDNNNDDDDDTDDKGAAVSENISVANVAENLLNLLS